MGKRTGFKIFNPDWTCREKQYQCPGVYYEDVIPKLCRAGMHFCKEIKDCFKYYPNADSTYHIAKVTALGRVDECDDDTMCCTDVLKIEYEIPWDEVMRYVNTGKDCTGVNNSGDYNTGDYNSGHCNSGNHNSGHYNTGDWNCGNCNFGDCNTGDWNTVDGSSGCFNTEEHTIMMFNKPSNWTLRDWWDSAARRYLIEMRSVVNDVDCTQAWWNRLNDYEKIVIMSLPNFDAKVFKECTGIDVYKKGERHED